MNTKTNSKKIIATLIVMIVVLTGAGITAFICVFNSTGNQDTAPELSGIVFDNNASSYDATVPNKGGTETGIKVPGYNDITIPADSNNIPITLLNPKGNPCNFKFSLEIAETGEQLCTTDYVKPGDAIKGVDLNSKIPKGSYTLLINIKTASLDTGAEMNGAQVKTQLEIV